jgi:hypothetical protein
MRGIDEAALRQIFREEFARAFGVGERSVASEQPAAEKWLYAMLCKKTGMYKIGISNDPETRRAQLAWEYLLRDDELEIVGARRGTADDEWDTHRCLSRHVRWRMKPRKALSKGREWYSPDKEVIEWVEKLPTWPPAMS